MSFIKSIQNRYTTKKYDNSKKIEQQKIEELKEILRLCPSSINSQPWQFLFVSDEQKKQELAKVSYFNKEKVEECDTIIVFSRIDNIAYFEEYVNTNLSTSTIGYYNKFLKSLPEAQLKSWFDRQVYIALGVFLSACAEMQIDSTTLEGIETEKYDKILELKDYKTLFAVAIGYRDESDENQLHKVPKRRKTLDEVIKSI